MAAELVRHRFAEQGATLVAESQDLFRTLYDFHYDADVRKHISAIEKKIAQAFKTSDLLDGNVAGRRIETGAIMIGYYAACVFKVEIAKRPVLDDQDGYNDYVAVEDGTPLAARLVAFGDAVAQVSEDIQIAHREALGALQQFSTGKRLAADWPEAMPVIGHLIPEDDRTLPVVQVAGLNMKFKLPPKLAA
jgi:hypothetical protein